MPSHNILHREGKRHAYANHKISKLWDVLKGNSHSERNKKWPVWGVSPKFLLIDISREKLYVTPSTFNILLKLYRILYNQCCVFIAKFRYLCRQGKMFGITCCLKTCKINIILKLWLNSSTNRRTGLLVPGCEREMIFIILATIKKIITWSKK